MAELPVPPGTVLRVRSAGVPRMYVSPSPSGQRGNIVLRTPPKPTLVRVPGIPGAPGPPGGIETIYFSASGRAEPRPPRHRVYLEGAYTLESVRVTVVEPPLGSPLVVDVLAGTGDGDPVSIYHDDDDRPTVTPLTYTGLGGPVVVDFAAGDYLTTRVVMVGSTFPGVDPMVTVRLLRTG